MSHAVTSTYKNSESNSSDKNTLIVEKAVMGSAEEGERLHDVEPGQEPLRRSRRQSRQKSLPSEGSDSDDEPPSGKNKKPRLSDNIKLEVVPPNSSSSSSAGVQAYWTTAMVGLYIYYSVICCIYIYILCVLQDARLTEGVAKHKEQSWARVAEFVGDGLTADQCQSRWNSYLGPLQRGLKRGNWQPDEVPIPAATTLTYTDTSLDSLSCLYLPGGALAGAGATTCDPLAFESDGTGTN